MKGTTANCKNLRNQIFNVSFGHPEYSPQRLKSLSFSCSVYFCYGSSKNVLKLATLAIIHRMNKIPSMDHCLIFLGLQQHACRMIPASLQQKERIFSFLKKIKVNKTTENIRSGIILCYILVNRHCWFSQTAC